MAVDAIKLDFTSEFKGTMITPKGEFEIGRYEAGLRPYHMLLGALGSCFYATFLEIIEKKRLTFEGATIEVSGTQRKEIPTTLDYVLIKMTVANASNEEQFTKSAQLGAKYCSIFDTISKVAKIEVIVEFTNK